MIDLKTLERFYDEASHLDIEDALDAWGIDKDAFSDFLQGITEAGLADMVNNRNPKVSVATIFLIGFEMGYKMSLDAEMRLRSE